MLLIYNHIGIQSLNILRIISKIEVNLSWPPDNKKFRNVPIDSVITLLERDMTR